MKKIVLALVMVASLSSAQLYDLTLENWGDYEAVYLGHYPSDDLNYNEITNKVSIELVDGHLATISDYEEWARINDYMAPIRITNGMNVFGIAPLIGGITTGGGNGEWIDGTPWSFSWPDFYDSDHYQAYKYINLHQSSLGKFKSYYGRFKSYLVEYPPRGTIAASYLQEISTSTSDIYEVSVIPMKGYIFNGWSGLATGTNNPLTITIQDNASIGALFSKDIYRDNDSDGLNNYEEYVQQTLTDDSDSDDDGYNDGLEYSTGYDPLSALESPDLVSQIARVIRFRFPSEAGKSYQIEQSVNLSDWQLEEINIIGTGGWIERTYDDAELGSNQFFRVIKTN